MKDVVVCKKYIERLKDLPSYRKAFKKMMAHVEDHLGSLHDLDAIAHRVVHGGKITEHCRVTKRVIKEIENAIELAPLHDIPELRGIKLMQNIDCPQFVIFDNVFHNNMPSKASTYAIPRGVSKKYKIRRYGFHGMSHQYIAEYMKKHYPKAKKVISCHLGNGSSVAAIKSGKSIDTSMGFTPLEGLMMGTRSGDTDPGLVLYLLHKLGWKKVTVMLNSKSGLKGIAGSNDMRDLCRSKTKKCREAVQMYAYRVAKYIGSYAAVLNGVDAIVFTAGIGQNQSFVRNTICDYLTHLDVKLDKKKNKANKTLISRGKVKVLVIPTNESLIMMKETKKLLRNSKP